MCRIFPLKQRQKDKKSKRGKGLLVYGSELIKIVTAEKEQS